MTAQHTVAYQWTRILFFFLICNDALNWLLAPSEALYVFMSMVVIKILKLAVFVPLNLTICYLGRVNLISD